MTAVATQGGENRLQELARVRPGSWWPSGSTSIW